MAFSHTPCGRNLATWLRARSPYTIVRTEMFMLLTLSHVRPPPCARQHLARARRISMRAPSVGVIGGGIAGVTAARTLAQAGVPVVLHEREPQLGGRLGALDGPGLTRVGAGCSYIKGANPEFVSQLEAWEQVTFEVGAPTHDPQSYHATVHQAISRSRPAANRRACLPNGPPAHIW